MKNCIPRRENFNSQWRRAFGSRSLLASCIAVMVLALLWVQPVAAQAQAVGPVFALPGTLTRATQRDYDTILTIAPGNQYGLVGQTPQVEAQIVQFRSQGESFEVKVWGDRFAPVRDGELEVIVVSSIQQSDATPPTAAPTAAPTNVPTATPQPTPSVPAAVVTAANVNVRSGPGTDYPAIGNLIAGQVCTVVGRNQAATWWQLSCPAGVTSGWVLGDLLGLTGAVASVPVIQVAAPPTPVPPTTFANWKSSFFPNRDLSGNPVLTVDSPNINFNWGEGSPGSNVPNDNFSARFERTMDFSFGTYELRLTMDDGARVFVDDQLVINDWAVGSLRTRTAQLILSGSKRFRVEYFEATGNAQVQFSVNLVSSSEVWQATYYAGRDSRGQQLLTRGEPRGSSYPLNYDWGRGSPAPGVVPVDQFFVRWSGTFYFEPGDYRFNAISDDGIHVYIDGILILDRWLNGANSVSNTFRGIGGGNHQIVVEYYEDFGDANVRVWWERVDGNNSGGGGGNNNSGRPRDE